MAKYININGKEYPVYATAEEADEYFAAFFNSGWDAISDEDKLNCWCQLQEASTECNLLVKKLMRNRN